MSGERGATVEFRDVTKRYADQIAVDGLAFTVPAGKICILVGPSGSGKTTSLKMVNRLIEPTGGRILIDGVDAASRELTDLRRSIGYVIQQVGLFPHQTIGENVRARDADARRRAERSRAHEREVDGCGDRGDRFVRADVGGRLLAPDVLLAGLQRVHEPARAGRVPPSGRRCVRASAGRGHRGRR